MLISEKNVKIKSYIEIQNVCLCRDLNPGPNGEAYDSLKFVYKLYIVNFTKKCFIEI